MVRTLLYSLCVFVAVATGAYGITWFAQASQLKRAIERGISSMNDKGQYISYDSLSTSGFPRDVSVSILRPRFSGRIDTLLHSAAPENDPAAQAMISALPEWNEDIALEGSITFTVNILSSQYSARMTGNWKHNATLGAQSFSTLGEIAGDSGCTVTIHPSAELLTSLWSVDSLLKNEQLLQDFRLLDCPFAQTTVKDGATGDLLMHGDPGRLYIESTPKDGNRYARLYIKGANLITPQGDKLIAAYFRVLDPAASFPPRLSAFGKQLVEMDASYDGPAEWNEQAKNAPFAIALNKLEMRNDVYESSTASQISNAMTGGKRDARFYFKAESSFTKTYDTLLREGVYNFIQQLYAPQNPYTGAKPYLERYAPDELYAIVLPALPHFHPLGKMTQIVDASYSGNQNFTEGAFNLKEFEFSFSPYGLTGSGSAERHPQRMVPAGTLTLNCRECPQLIHDTVEYLGKVQTTWRYFEPERHVPFSFNATFSRSLDEFLRSIAAPSPESPDNAIYSYTLLSDGMGGITLNNLRMDDIMALYQKHLAPAVTAPTAP